MYSDFEGKIYETEEQHLSVFDTIKDKRKSDRVEKSVIFFFVLLYER